jgi:DNA primase large subunit
METVLFKYRLDRLSDEEREIFMVKNGLQFEMVSENEKNKLSYELRISSNLTELQFERALFYKVPFLQALSLVGNRTVYLAKGFAYVPVTKFVAILTNKFRMFLSKHLTELAREFDHICQEGRIGPILQNMPKQFIGQDFLGKQNNGAAISDTLRIDTVDPASTRHFPLCMKYLYQTLNKEHKLKHWSRLQLMLFLKGAGLSYEEGLLLMQRHFTRVMSTDQFTKQYAYSFRHMFGKEGGRKNYTPYSCLKIQSQVVDPGSTHGCPFKHQSDSMLLHLLSSGNSSSVESSTNISSQEAKEIVSVAKQQGQYQFACQRHFDLLHPNHIELAAQYPLESMRSEMVAQHPNQWFQASVIYHRLKSGTVLNPGNPGNMTSHNNNISNSPSSTENITTMEQEVDMMSNNNNNNINVSSPTVTTTTTNNNNNMDTVEAN